MGKPCEPSAVELEKLQQWVAAHGTPQQAGYAAGKSDAAMAGPLSVAFSIRPSSRLTTFTG
jgi:hypothetical protein